MSKVVIINKNNDFKRLYKRGNVYTNPALVTYIMRNSAGVCRVGITSSKKIGNAVQRNRSRRVVRAAFHEINKTYATKLKGYDIIFVCRVKTRFKKSTEIEKIIVSHLREAKII
ncbi:MAG: ribonuclease P protein component [Ruminococcaceae bacterium]|nr:ribonuclease P protein component [Oscillospiraceae bacterium]